MGDMTQFEVLRTGCVFLDYIETTGLGGKKKATRACGIYYSFGLLAAKVIFPG